MRGGGWGGGGKLRTCLVAEGGEAGEIEQAQHRGTIDAAHVGEVLVKLPEPPACVRARVLVCCRRSHMRASMSCAHVELV